MIQTRIEGSRGCGVRKAGGLYMVAPGMGAPCGRLPIPLDVCPCCGGGVKPSRGWTWINLQALSASTLCANRTDCLSCPLNDPPTRAGLIWVGEAFYSTPQAFTTEAARMGISRRIPHVPKGFTIGEHWVALAHRKAIQKGDKTKSAIFHLFRPTAIEYVVHGKETQEEIQTLVKKGITPVKVINPQTELPWLN